MRYVVQGKDGGQVALLMRTLPLALVEELPAMFVRYLRDSDSWLAKVGWSLSHFCTSNGVNRYRAGIVSSASNHQNGTAWNGVGRHPLPDRSAYKDVGLVDLDKIGRPS